jgi:acetyl-CoA carboxylase carboxyl transferase subunit beta
MSWFLRKKKNIESKEQKNMPDGLWTKDPIDGEMIYKSQLESNYYISPTSGYHFRIGSKEYINILCDEGTFTETETKIKSADPLEFEDTKKYPDRIAAGQKKSGLNDAITTGTAQMGGKKVSLAIMNFNFIGGSMGSVVGEKIYRAAKLSLKEKIPFILISASGGARMQEAALSLMQMAKSSAILAELGESEVPYISILTDPTTGGVTASYAMLGDVNIAEPGALIGFAGPRVIEQTINKKLPEGFQRAEFLLEHGFVDQIIPRNKLKQELIKIINWFKN